MDGVLLPTAETAETPVYFLEVQFQPDPTLYRRLLAEILLYLRQNQPVRYWRAIVVYPQPSVEVQEIGTLHQWLQPPTVQTIYLNQLGMIPQLPIGLAILRLVVEPVSSVPQAARGLVDRVQQAPLTDADRNKFVELIETIVVYAFPRLSRQEIAAMLGITDMRETRVFQDALEEGRQAGLQEGRQAGLQEGRQEGLQEGRQAGLQEGRREEARAFVLRLLNRKVGQLSEAVQSRVSQLSLDALETLGEALMDFSGVADLQAWLERQAEQ